VVGQVEVRCRWDSCLLQSNIMLLAFFFGGCSVVVFFFPPPLHNFLEVLLAYFRRVFCLFLFFY
jgi:hypothetical protein